MNIDPFKSLCSNVTKYANGEIWGYFGEFVVLSTDGYSDNITIFYPSKKVGFIQPIPYPMNMKRPIINLMK